MQPKSTNIHPKSTKNELSAAPGLPFWHPVPQERPHGSHMVPNTSKIEPKLSQKRTNIAPKATQNPKPFLRSLFVRFWLVLASKTDNFPSFFGTRRPHDEKGPTLTKHCHGAAKSWVGLSTDDSKIDQISFWSIHSGSSFFWQENAFQSTQKRCQNGGQVASKTPKDLRQNLQAGKAGTRQAGRAKNFLHF